MRLLMLAASILLCAHACRAMPCSLIVSVEQTSGPRAVPVTVVEKDGTRWEAKTIDGIARFCGLGMHSVTVIVGTPPCTVATVSPVFVDQDLKSTNTLKVYLDDKPCYIDLGVTPPVGCRYLFRIFGPGRQQVVDASFTAISTSSRIERKADEFGRVFYTLPQGQTVEGLSSAAGYEAVKEVLTCQAATLATVEKVVILRKK